MKEILKQLKPYSKKIALICFLLLLQVIADVSLPYIMSKIINEGVVLGKIAKIYELGFYMLMITLAGAICVSIGNLLISIVSSLFARDVTEKIYSKVVSFSKSELNEIPTSSLITRTVKDVTVVQRFIMMALKMMVTAPLMCIGGIYIALSKDPKLSMIYLISVPILVLLIFIIAKKALPIFTKLQEKVDRITLILREKLIGVRVIRAFGMQKYEEKRFDNASRTLSSSIIEGEKYLFLLMPLSMLIVNCTMIAVLWIGAERVDLNMLQVGDLMAFIQISTLILFSIISFSMSYVMLPQAVVSMKRIKEIFDLQLSIKEKDLEETEKNAKKMKGIDIKFKNVNFAYKNTKENVLDNINFEVKKGETLAILGTTGAGKTTILNLILRFYDAIDGEITIGGVNIKNLSLKKLRSMIGYVPQKAYLFSGTIEENIKFGNEKATKKDIEKAAEISQSKSFIEGFKEKYKYKVAQGGSNFSGGQKQRLAIARAIIKNPDIFIFDDSFSALDYKTESVLRKELQNNFKEAIKVIVAQRVSTVIHADHIILLEKGKIIAAGNHEKLYKSSLVYKEIVDSQINSKEVEEYESK